MLLPDCRCLVDGLLKPIVNVLTKASRKFTLQREHLGSLPAIAPAQPIHWAVDLTSSV